MKTESPWLKIYGLRKMIQQKINGKPNAIPTIVTNADGTYSVEEVPCGNIRRTFANNAGRKRLLKTASLNIPNK